MDSKRDRIKKGPTDAGIMYPQNRKIRSDSQSPKGGRPKRTVEVVGTDGARLKCTHRESTIEKTFRNDAWNFRTNYKFRRLRLEKCYLGHA
jgi:hypothetical protein